MSVRAKLALSYAAFFMVASVLLLAVIWVFLLRYVPEEGIFVPYEPYYDGDLPLPDLDTRTARSLARLHAQGGLGSFQRGTERVRSDQAGVGLGLTIVRSIVQAHDGTLTIEGRPDGGLRVSAVLPTGDWRGP